MELKVLINILYKNALQVVVFLLIGAVGGATTFILPQKYTATGSFYVKRTIQNSSDFFTYEGYYGQQTALAYANTVFALLESTDLKSMTLKKLGTEVNEQTLRKLHKKTDIKKTAPQLVSLTVKDFSPSEAAVVWNALSESLLETTYEINKNGDSALSISKISEEPVVKQTYNNLWLNLSAGAVLGFVFGAFSLALKEYLRGEKHK